MQAEININDSGIYTVSGELSFSSVAGLYPGPFASQTAIRLDLGGVSRADSAGVALLLQWAQDASQRNVKIQFNNIPEQLAAMIRVAEVETVFGL